MQGRIAFTREQLDGVPEDVISGYTQRTEGDKVLYEVTFKTPDIFPVVSFRLLLIDTCDRILTVTIASSNMPTTRKRAKQLKKRLTTDWQTMSST